MYICVQERSKQGQINNNFKAKQHSIPKAVTFPKKNELPRVGSCKYYREMQKEQQGQTNNKAKQHSTYGPRQSHVHVYMHICVHFFHE